MSQKPVVLVTRKLPDAVEEQLAKHFELILNPDDRLYSTEELLETAASVDAILPCHTEKFSAETIASLPERVKAIANYSVGVDHVDLAAASTPFSGPALVVFGLHADAGVRLEVKQGNRHTAHARSGTKSQ